MQCLIDRRLNHGRVKYRRREEIDLIEKICTFNVHTTFTNKYKYKYKLIYRYLCVHIRYGYRVYILTWINLHSSTRTDY